MRATIRWFTMTVVVVTLMLALAQTAPAVMATGGTVTLTNGYWIHTFTTAGTTSLNVTVGGNVEVLVVAGGGGGGNSLGGGGGAGGLIYTGSYAVTSGSITVTVGAGGAGGIAAAGNGGFNGSNSVFGALTAYGGGGGGGWSGEEAKSGGSGGGAHAGKIGALGTNGQGNAGGDGGPTGVKYPAGGGGGAGAAGGNGVEPASGDGGIGLQYSISGAATYYAGGGGGGSYLSGPSGTGGDGGGGNGGVVGGNNPGSPGQANTGGGGGAGAYLSAYSAGGAGGSGIVIVRYMSTTPSIANSAATNVTSTSAWLNGTLTSTGAAPTTVFVYWGTTDATTNKAAWAYTNDFGQQAEGPLTTNVTGLSSNTTYYYRFYATNSYGEDWARSSESFKTHGLPGVNNGDGATAVGFTAATLNGNLTNGGSADVYIYWGTDTNNWANTNDLGTLNEGSFSTNIAGLITNTTYYYRCYATNTYGEDWADSATNFITAADTGEYYVTPEGGGAVDGSSWENAFSNIQDAVDVAQAGGTVWVTNGTYAVMSQIVVTNGITVQSVNGKDFTTVTRGGTNQYRIFLISNATAVVDGFTVSNGNPGAANGGAVWMSAGTIRDCNLVSNSVSSAYGGAVYMTGGTIRDCNVTYNGSSTSVGGGLYLDGSCLVSNCFIAWNLGGEAGGGGIKITGAAAGAMVTHCVINNNTNGLYNSAGGIYMSAGTVRNCLIAGNRVTHGDSRGSGGVRQGGGILLNCTIAGNQGLLGISGGGVGWAAGSITNTIIYGNTVGPDANNLYASSLTTIGYSCAPELINGTNGNTTIDPDFIDMAGGNYRLALGSPCIDSGTNVPELTTDLDGATRPQDGDGDGAAQWDMGAYEAQAFTSGVLRCSFSGSPRVGMAPLEVVYQATVAGADTNGLVFRWDVNGDGTNDYTGAGFGMLTNVYTPGVYNVALSVTNAAAETAQRQESAYIIAQVPAMYVSTVGAHTTPFTNWVIAATNLADALALAGDGTTITVTNGVYDCIGLTLQYGTVLRSVNGSAATTLRNPPSSTARLLDITHPQAEVSGFTLVGGAPGAANGGAVWMSAGTIRDCNLVSNNVTGDGSGAAVYMTGGAVRDCNVTYNSGSSGGGAGLYLAGSCLVSNCFIAWNRGSYYGGGIGMVASGAIVTDCVINDNTNNSYLGCGGIYMSAGTVRNSLIAGNRQTFSDNRARGGVGMNGGTLLSCTIADNQGLLGIRGGGVGWTGGSITNTIIYGNTVGGTNNNFDNTVGSTPPVAYSCAPELTNGVGNITNEPIFVATTDADYHLASGSPCINTGTNQAWMIGAFDLDGNPRVVGKVDIGAYEWQPPGGTSILIR